MKYRKKPVVIEAVKFGLFEFADNVTFAELPTWLSEAIKDGTVRPDFRSEDYWYLVIKTLEGEMTASPGDYIIHGVKGELYPCKPDIFEASYEAVEG